MTRQNKKTFSAFILIALLGLAAYSNSFSVPFQFDDNSSIVNNQVIRHLGNFTSSLKGYHYNPRRVVGYATFALNYHFGGLNTTGYHIANLAIHIINGILVYFLVILTFRTPYFRWHSAGGIAQQTGKLASRQAGSESSNLQPLTSIPPADRPAYLIALFAALLFVVHPLQTESVTYIVQRFASLATMFYLLSIVFYIKGRLKLQTAESIAHGAKREEPDSPYVRRKNAFSAVPYALCSLLFAVLAMGTKETAYTLPFMIVIFEFLFFTSETGRRRLFLLTAVVVAGVSAVIFFIMSRLSPGAMLSRLSTLTMVQSYGSRWVYFVTELRVIVSYIRLTFFPINQTIDYDFPIYHSLAQPPVLLSSLFLLSLMALAGYLIYKSRGHGAKGIGQQAGKQQATSYKLASLQTGSESSHLQPQTSDFEPFVPYYRLIAFGILWFFIALSIESSFLPIADVIFEHRMYLPSVGALIAVVAGCFTLAGHLSENRRRAVVIIFSVIVILFGAATYARNEVWASSVSLWEDAVKKAPQLARPYFSLGAEYAKSGAYEKAIGMYQKALAMPRREYLELRPGEYPKMYNAVGLLYARLGRYNEAIDVFQGLLSRYPDFAGAYNNLGAAYVNSGRYREAIRPLLKALERKPDNLDARYNLALAYYGSGNRGAAMREAAILKRFSPQLASHLLSQIR